MTKYIDRSDKIITAVANASTEHHTAQELVALKVIITAVAGKLSQNDRKDLIENLSKIDSPIVADWVKSFRDFTSD